MCIDLVKSWLLIGRNRKLKPEEVIQIKMNKVETRRCCINRKLKPDEDVGLITSTRKLKPDEEMGSNSHKPSPVIGLDDGAKVSRMYLLPWDILHFHPLLNENVFY